MLQAAFMVVQLKGNSRLRIYAKILVENFGIFGGINSRINLRILTPACQ